MSVPGVSRRAALAVAAGMVVLSFAGCDAARGSTPEPSAPGNFTPRPPGDLGYRSVEPRDLPNEAGDMVVDASGERIIFLSTKDPSKRIVVGRGSNRVFGVDSWASGMDEATRYRIAGGQGVCGTKFGETVCMVQTEAFADVDLKAEGMSLEELRVPAEAIAEALVRAQR